MRSMNQLESAWDLFLNTMSDQEPVLDCYRKFVTGLPFIYVQKKHQEVSREEIEESLKISAAKAMKGKTLTLSMYYVRESEDLFVYRIRFLVPQRKMFCCGNLCEDCIRFQR